MNFELLIKNINERYREDSTLCNFILTNKEQMELKEVKSYKCTSFLKAYSNLQKYCGPQKRTHDECLDFAFLEKKRNSAAQKLIEASDGLKNLIRIFEKKYSDGVFLQLHYSPDGICRSQSRDCPPEMIDVPATIQNDLNTFTFQPINLSLLKEKDFTEQNNE